MTIVLCGGGSGGHITPLIAVASELRSQRKNLRLIYIGEKGGKFSHIAKDSKLFDELHFISAGKLRRYHGESLGAKLLDVKTMFFNLRDLFRLFAGLIQAYRLLGRLKANSAFLKGGYVCVPIAMAARLHGVPYITHDSDALPGLSNRIAARWARYHATAMPAKYYSYPSESIKVVGLPSDERFRQYSASEKRILRDKYNLPADAKVLLVTGGSNGARRVNEAVLEMLPKLLAAQPNLHVLHQIGAGNEDQIKDLSEDVNDRVRFFDFSPELFHMSAVSDVIVTRAGASAIADYASQEKACVVIPNPYLTGGHQLKNAQVYEEAKAAVIITEDEITKKPSRLYLAVNDLLNDEKKRKEIAENLANLTKANKKAASSIAELMFEVSKV